MRRCLKILGWMGISLSALLFVATGVFWVRSMGHWEVWSFRRFEPRPDWTAPGLAEQGTRRAWGIGAMHGRLWLGLETRAPEREVNSGPLYQRKTFTADEAKQEFDWYFQPGQPPRKGCVKRTWRFAGAGFVHARDAVDPAIGPPCEESSYLAIPFWMLAVVFGIWPALFVTRRLLRKKRFAAGLCRQCGYDLRATPERCPECGREVVEKGE